MLTGLDKGNIVELKFDDHAEGSTEVLPFLLYGKVMKVTKKTVVIGCWIYPSKEKLNHNTTHFAILKSAIRKCRVMHYA